MRDNHFITMTLQNLKTIKSIAEELNEDDIFFARMEQYLRKKEAGCNINLEQTRFIFEKLKTECEESKVRLSMELFLDTLQKYLVAKHNFPNELFRLPREVFFDCLFDAAFEMQNEWGCYTQYFSSIDLSLDDIEKIITVSYYFLDSMHSQYNCNSFLFMQSSSYPHQAPIAFLLALRFEQEYKRETGKDIRNILTALSNLFIIYSVNYDKPIPEADEFFNTLTKFILSKESTKETVLKKIEDKINEFKTSNDFNTFKEEKLHLSKCRNKMQENLLQLLGANVLITKTVNYQNTKNDFEFNQELIRLSVRYNSLAELLERDRTLYCKKTYDLAISLAEKHYPRWSKKSAAEREAELADSMMNYLFT